MAVLKFQWLRTWKRQEYGLQEEIEPITEKIFLEDIFPWLAPYEPSFSTWKKEHPDVTHVLWWRDPNGDKTFMDAGPLSRLLPAPSERRVIQVSSWDEPRAVRWARLLHPPKKQDWSSRDDA